MTSKVKALELFNKYAMYLRANLMYDEEANEDAKQCALITIDEVIKALQEHEWQNRNVILEYQQIKKEIENL
jgi:hypothetical protein